MKDKCIKLQGSNWSIKAQALGVPSKDVCISVAMNRTMKYSDVADARLAIEEGLQSWFLDSTLLDPKHLIKEIKTPYYSHQKEMSMVFVMDVSVLTRRVIESGRGDNCFQNVFGAELGRLVEYLGLDIKE